MAETRAYFDTSAILPLYRTEPATAQAEKMLARWSGVVSALTEVEVASALARWVRMGELTEQQAQEVEAAFADDLLQPGLFTTRSSRGGSRPRGYGVFATERAANVLTRTVRMRDRAKRRRRGAWGRRSRSGGE